MLWVKIFILLGGCFCGEFAEAFSDSGSVSGDSKSNLLLTAEEANTFHQPKERCLSKSGACISETSTELSERRKERRAKENRREDYVLGYRELKSLMLGCCGSGQKNSCTQNTLNHYKKRAKAGGVDDAGFVRTTCAVSFREDHGDCWCAQKRCGLNYYKAANPSCTNPCRNNQFYCNSFDSTRVITDKTCVAKTMQCNSNRDCPNAEDENGCKIGLDLAQLKSSTKLSFEAYAVSLSGSTRDNFKFPKNEFVGVTFIKERPICSLQSNGKPLATKETATVFCKSMKNTGTKTRGIPIALNFKEIFSEKAHIYTGEVKAPLMTNVNCNGKESHIGECPHKTYNDACDSQKSEHLLAVACLDPQQLKLTRYSHLIGSQFDIKFVGKPTYMGLPIVWDYRTYMHLEKTICTTLFGEEFQRGKDGVPRISTGASRIYRTPCLVVICNKAEQNINDCDITYKAWCSAEYKFPKTSYTNIMCAKCSLPKLIEIVKLVKATAKDKSTDVLKTVRAAQTRLKAECWWWDDCLKNQADQKYKEYCMVKNFLDNALYALQPALNKAYYKGTQVVNLPHQMVDSKKLLELTKVNLQFSEMQGLILALGEKITQTIGTYFREVAQYDRELAKADVAYAYGKWKQSQHSAAALQTNIDQQLNKIIVAAMKTADKNVEYEKMMMSLTLLNAMNPMRLISFDFGGVLEVAEQLRALEQATKDKLILSFLPEQLGKLKEHANKMALEIRNNLKVFDKVKKMVSSSEKEIQITDFKSSKSFLDAYNDYTPAVTKNGISKFVSLVEELIEKCCETIEGSVAEVAKAEIKAQSCPKIKAKLAIMEAYFEDLEEQQFDIMDSLARVARAKVVEHNAVKLKETASGPKPQLEKTILEKNIEVVLRTQRLMYVNDVCNYLTYMRHGIGIHLKDCKKLKEDPTLTNAFQNILGQRDLKICESSHLSTKWVKIPVSSLKMEKGYMNITALFDPAVGRKTTFRIPNRQWLVDNKWIYKDDSGPFYIKKVNLHLPPTNGKKNQYKVVIKFDGLNKVGDKLYRTNIQELTNEYTENKIECVLMTGFNSRYSVKACKGSLNKVCINSIGEIADRYLPVLVGNTWDISMKMLRGKMKPLHLSEGFVHAQIIVCARESLKKREKLEVAEVEKRSRGRDCCLPKQIWSKEKNKCVDCPADYQPYLWDTFCEMCLPGYESTTRKFGCRACRKGTFKGQSGPGTCKICPSGKTTNGSAATECV